MTEEFTCNGRAVIFTGLCFFVAADMSDDLSKMKLCARWDEFQKLTQCSDEELLIVKITYPMQRLKRLNKYEPPKS